MRLAAILASALATLLMSAWAMKSPGLDSAGACAGAVAAFISCFFLKREEKSDRQTQHVSDSSVAIQAGRDANVRNLKKE